MRTHARTIAVIVLLVVALAGGCRREPSRRADTPPPTPMPPAPGMAISGFWTSWGRPLRQCLADHRARHGAECRGRLAVTIQKSARRLVVSCDGEPVKGYFIALGLAPEGTKERRGDNRTPEGRYFLWRKNRQSRYYLSLGVSYPNGTDADRGLGRGLIDLKTHRRIVQAVRAGKSPPRDTRLGGDIYIHGGGMGEIIRREGRRYVKVRDWTAGCVALRNRDIEELMAVLPVGTPIEIRA